MPVDSLTEASSGPAMRLKNMMKHLVRLLPRNATNATSPRRPCRPPLLVNLQRSPSRFQLRSLPAMALLPPLASRTTLGLPSGSPAPPLRPSLVLPPARLQEPLSLSFIHYRTIHSLNSSTFWFSISYLTFIHVHPRFIHSFRHFLFIQSTIYFLRFPISFVHF